MLPAPQSRSSVAQKDTSSASERPISVPQRHPAAGLMTPDAQTVSDTSARGLTIAVDQRHGMMQFAEPNLVFHHFLYQISCMLDPKNSVVPRILPIVCVVTENMGQSLQKIPKTGQNSRSRLGFCQVCQHFDNAVLPLGFEAD